LLLIYAALTNIGCGVQAEAAEKQAIAPTSATGQSQPNSGSKLSKEVDSDYLLAENINIAILVLGTHKIKQTLSFYSVLSTPFLV